MRCAGHQRIAPIHEADPLAQHPRAGRFPDQLHAQTKRFRDCENRCCPGAALAGNSTFLRARSGRVFDQEWTARRQTLGRNLARAFVRTHFEVMVDPKSGLVAGAKCVECAAEDEKQKLNEAMAELQELTTPSMKTPTDPDQREKQQSQLQPPPQR